MREAIAVERPMMRTDPRPMSRDLLRTIVPAGILDADVDALMEAIAEFRTEPTHARWATTADIGECWDASRAFAIVLDRRGVPYTFRRFRSPPWWRGDFQHAIEVSGVMVDWTARQNWPNCGWPHVVTGDHYISVFGPPQPLCGECGASAGPLRVVGKNIKRTPLHTHVCRGPAYDSTAELESVVRKLVTRLSPEERRRLVANLSGQLAAEVGKVVAATAAGTPPHPPSSAFVA